MFEKQLKTRKNTSCERWNFFVIMAVCLVAISASGYIVWYNVAPGFRADINIKISETSKTGQENAGITYDQIKAYAVSKIPASALPEPLPKKYPPAQNAAKQDVQMTIKGSCIHLQLKSQCLDYIGAYWTAEHMAANCNGIGELTDEPCPQPSIGGCYVGNQTHIENIMWSYPYGGRPVTEKNMELSKKTCESTPGAIWINGIIP